MTRAALVLVLLLGGCALTTRGVRDYAVLDVTVVAGGAPVANATVALDDASEAESAVSTDTQGTATTYARWAWHRNRVADDAGDYHDVLVTITAAGYLPWQSVIRVRPARIQQVRATLMR